MDARELRIGNYHKSDGIEIPRMDISSVKIDGQSFSAITGYGIYLVQDGKLDFEPIPLSEEWLLRFGFRQLNETDWESPVNCYRWDTAREGMQFFTQDGEWLFFSNADCDYVHQLQNLYFSLCGKELELKGI